MQIKMSLQFPSVPLSGENHCDILVHASQIRMLFVQGLKQEHC